MKTRLILKSFTLFMTVFLIYFGFTGATGNTSPTNIATTCNLRICVTNSGGTPLANQDIQIYSGGVSVAHCTTDSTGCCTSSYNFTDGKPYAACDMSVPCLSNCKLFTANCLLTTVAMHDCGN